MSKNDFIKEIGVLMQAEAKARGYQICSAAIAQACIESRYGDSGLAKYHNYFGLKCGSSWKGASVNMKTKEEYKVGTLTDIRANFRAYSSMAEGVKGYYDFIGTKRYANLKTATTPREYLERIKADGYATSSTYVETNMSVVRQYNLSSFDIFEAVTKPSNVEYYPKCSLYATILVAALSSVGETDTSYPHRKQIALANNILMYSGTEKQNIQMLKLLKEGKLIKA